MNIGLYQSAASLSALERWQDTVSQNITSSQTTGYRRRTVQFDSQYAGAIYPESHKKTGMDAGVSSVFPRTSAGIDFVSGETTPTRRELDIAIQGDGFFEVQMPDGEKAYTRNGEFRLRPDRTLVTSAGLEVLDTNGDPFVLLPGSGAVTVNQDGAVFQGGVPLGKFSIQRFGNTAALIPKPGDLFQPGPGADMSAVEAPEVMQGYLEQSNVQPLREMVDIVVISRAYEANQKMITAIDEQMGKVLQALG